MDRQRTRELLDKASAGQGLFREEMQFLFDQNSEADRREIYDRARRLTEMRFNKKLHFFAPLYFSNFCVNECLYCGFQRSNRSLKRKALTEEEFLKEAHFLWTEGHRTLLLIAGEHPVYAGVGQIASYMTALRREGLDFSIMIEVGPLSVEDYGILRESGVRHCLLFQETYDPEAYEKVHRGKKGDYGWRLKAMERALEAGMENVGLGILLGLGTSEEDLIRLVEHAYEIKKKFGKFPATFSFPRLRPAYGVSFSEGQFVPDEMFENILAISRLACPEVGIVLTTREKPQFRKRLLQRGMGITHMSAGSSTLPGGYTLKNEAGHGGQFELFDHRSLREVEQEALSLGYHPVAIESDSRVRSFT